VTPIRLERNISKLLELQTSNLVGSFVLRMPSRRTNNFPDNERGLGHVTPDPYSFLAVRSAILATARLLVLTFLYSVHCQCYVKVVL